MRTRLSLLAACAVFGVALTLIVGVSTDAQRLAPVTRPDGAARPAPPLDLTPEELANIRVYEAANRSVVHITTSTVQRDPVFGMPMEGEGAGSGCVLDKRGYILTNNHVVDDATRVNVTLANDRVYDAELIGADEEYDMAVLRIKAPEAELHPIRLGRSDNLRVGQKAYALGNPFGLDGTLTTGIVSSTNRSLPSNVGGRVMTRMIQTDAAMNPGNSGGPLLNTSAEMIGMCVAIRSSVGQNSGVGFAIPIDRVKRFLPELIEKGRVVRAYHGIVRVNETSRGLQIVHLDRDGPASRAGIRGWRFTKKPYRDAFGRVRTAIEEDRSYGDYLIAIDGKPVATHDKFIEIMDGHAPGERVVFTLLREGQTVEAPVTLEEA